jgi:hypothetical protein
MVHPSKRAWSLVSAAVVSASILLATTPARADGSQKSRVLVTLGLAGAAIASAGAGTYFLVSAEGAQRDLRDLPRAPASTPCLHYTSSTCAALAEARATESTHRALVMPFYVGAGLFAAGAAATYLLWPRLLHATPAARKGSARTAFAPDVRKGYVGAAWSVSF